MGSTAGGVHLPDQDLGVTNAGEVLTPVTGEPDGVAFLEAACAFEVYAAAGHGEVDNGASGTVMLPPAWSRDA